MIVDAKLLRILEKFATLENGAFKISLEKFEQLPDNHRRLVQTITINELYKVTETLKILQSFREAEE